MGRAVSIFRGLIFVFCLRLNRWQHKALFHRIRQAFDHRRYQLITWLPSKHLICLAAVKVLIIDMQAASRGALTIKVWP